MVTRNGHVKGIKVLVINPNSSVVLTGGLEYMIGDLGYSEVCTAFYYVGMDGLNGISPSARTAYLDGHSTHHILRAADAPVGEHKLCV
jgi:hypothetical protein